VADIDALVSGLVAHLDKVEQEATDTGVRIRIEGVETTARRRAINAERLGLVRATRDLIDQWRWWSDALEREVTADRATALGAFAQAVRIAARGWGVGVDKEDRDG
jgi:hypothetical protein